MIPESVAPSGDVHELEGRTVDRLARVEHHRNGNVLAADAHRVAAAALRIRERERRRLILCCSSASSHETERLTRHSSRNSLRSPVYDATMSSRVSFSAVLSLRDTVAKSSSVIMNSPISSHLHLVEREGSVEYAGQ